MRDLELSSVFIRAMGMRWLTVVNVGCGLSGISCNIPGRRDPCLSSDIVIHMRNLGQNGRHKLHSRSSITHDSNSLVGWIKRVIPVRSVDQGTLEVLKTSNVRPSPLVQIARRLDEDIAVILEDLKQGVSAGCTLFASNLPAGLTSS